MNNVKQHFISSVQFPLFVLIIMWVTHLVKATIWPGLYMYGIYPRELIGLRGIFLSPFIHGDLGHLISNSAPLFLMMVMILYFYRTVAMRSFLMIYFLSGLSVWLFARPVFHIGASGVVYGLVSFVFWSGVFRRSVKSIILALIVVFLYSGLIFGILPNDRGISWESHLLGGVVGLLTAYWYKEEIETDEERRDPEWLSSGEPKEHFLPRDIFEKTKAEREQDANRLW
ncbi:MAG: hypothetical protein CMN32_07955 [Saprospirales bacterium]|jgi:membrane associated rhomboid family serine protease|nr:hypothetical protein [Saprospirales bacterium]